MAMKQWIFKLLGRGSDEFRCVREFTKGDLRVLLLHYTKPCGHPGYLAEFHLYHASKGAWEPIGLFGGEDLHRANALLCEAAAYVDEVVERIRRQEKSPAGR